MKKFLRTLRSIEWKNPTIVAAFITLFGGLIFTVISLIIKPISIVNIDYISPKIKKELISSLKNNRDYFYEKVIVIIDLNIDDSASTLIANFTTCYHLFFLKNIHRRPLMFRDSLTSSHGQSELIPGNQPERLITINRVDVELIGNKYDRVTIITGGQIRSILPLPNNRKYFRDTILLTSNEWMYDYPNNNNTIGNFEVYIRSESLIFQSSEVHRSSQSRILYPKINNRRKWSTVSHNFGKVTPNEHIGLKIKFKKP